jgi:hypothetical protein
MIGGVLGQSKQDLVELVVVVAEHIHLDAQPDSREQMHKHAVHVVAADVEDAEIRAGCWPECALAGVLGEVVQREGLKGVRGADRCLNWLYRRDRPVTNNFRRARPIGLLSSSFPILN